MSKMITSDSEERRAEARWPGFFGLAIALTLYLLVPDNSTTPLRFVVVGILVTMFIPLFVINPHRLTRQTRWSRMMSIGLSLLLVAANQVNVVYVIQALLDGSGNGAQVLLTAFQVWITNIIAFGLLFWELDRGGPVARGNLPREQLPPADFAFPQDTGGDSALEVALVSSTKAGWRPGFVDYFYIALTNMTAFSPTDAMPLRSRTKLFMSLQSVTGFILLALVISRAVNILS